MVLGYHTSTELHGDLFSRQVSPLEGYVFVAVDERGEDVKSDEICCRYNGKQEKKETWRPESAAPKLVINKIKRQHTIIALTWVTETKPLSQGESLNVV